MNNCISKLLDENFYDNVVFVGDDGKEVEYEQVGVVSLEGELYAILHPVDVNIDDDEVVVYRIVDNCSNQELILEENEELIDDIFNEFYRLCQRNKK